MKLPLESIFPTGPDMRRNFDKMGDRNKMTATEVMQFIKDESIQVVDLKFVDLPGLWQHFSVSAQEFAEDAFSDGVGFDGSSIRGFQEINESDMLLFPDAS